MKNSLLSVLLTLWTVACSSTTIRPEKIRKNTPASLEKPYVLLISIDGYRYDYTKKYSPPTLSHLQEEGAAADSLIPSFPSKTFPNHYTIVTGLYPENHGIVANYFYDLTRKPDNNLYKLRDPAVLDSTWYGGSPIWSEAERQGMITASFFWPSDELEINGFRPSYAKKYDMTVPNRVRVQQILNWLKLPPADRPHFLTLYFSDVDSMGHSFGTESKQVQEAILSVDESIGTLMKGLEELSLPINVIIVSDHGMLNLNRDCVEYLDDYANLKDDVIVGDLGPQAALYITDKEKNPDHLDQIYSELRKKVKFSKVYKREDLPKNLHSSKNPRNGDIVVLGEVGCSLGIHDSRFRFITASHGYDPQKSREMQGIFYAYGPDIKSRQRIPSFENIHIYPFLLDLLKLNQPKNIDGNSKVLKGILKN